jgi:hypothetical protein
MHKPPAWLEPGSIVVGLAEEMLRILRGEAPLNPVNPACKAP